MQDWSPFLDVINSGGAVAILILFLWAFITERIVPRGRMLEWKELALRGTAIADNATKTAVELAPDASLQAQIAELRAELRAAGRGSSSEDA